MVWGRGGERERETKKHVANEGKKPFSPVYKIYIGKEDGVQYHLNDIVSFFIYIYILITKTMSFRTKRAVLAF